MGRAGQAGPSLHAYELGRAGPGRAQPPWPVKIAKFRMHKISVTFVAINVFKTAWNVVYWLYDV